MIDRRGVQGVQPREQFIPIAIRVVEPRLKRFRYGRGLVKGDHGNVFEGEACVALPRHFLSEFAQPAEFRERFQVGFG